MASSAEKPHTPPDERSGDSFSVISSNGHATLTDIMPTAYANGEPIHEFKHFERIIEPPLITPCLDLFLKGIRTFSSSANVKDIDIGAAYISIHYNELSPENQEIADALCEVSGGNTVYDPVIASKLAEPTVFIVPQRSNHERDVIIAVPVDEKTLASDITQKMNIFTDKFKNQPAEWIDGYTLDELKAWHGYDEQEDVDPAVFIGEEGGYYFDPDTGLFYDSKLLADLKKYHEQQAAKIIPTQAKP